MLTCKACKKKITKKDDVNILAFLGFRLDVFCNDCYSSKERGISSRLFYTPKQTINGKLYTMQLFTGTVAAVFVMLFALLLAIVKREFWLMLFLLILVPVSVQWLIWKRAKKLTESV